MEDYNNKNPPEDFSFSREFRDTEEDALSLSDLPINGYDHDLDTSCQKRRISTSSDQDPFEFSTGLASESLIRNDSVVLFGKDTNQIDGVEANEYHKRDYLCVKAASFHKPCDDKKEFDLRSFSRNRSISLRFTKSELFQPSGVQRVNITGITSMSATSRRRMFMFGLVKFKPEMDVFALKKRQSRRPMHSPPVPEKGAQVVARGGGSGGRGKSGGDDDGGLVRPSWRRSHLGTVLARSLGRLKIKWRRGMDNAFQILK